MRKYEKLLSPIFSIGLSVIIGAVVIYLCGFHPTEAYAALCKGAFGNVTYVLKTLEKSVPLIFCGLAAAVAMKSGMFNIGAEGQLFVGALGYTLAGLYFDFLPGVLHLAACVLVSALFGAAWAFVPAYMKLRLGANEVVTSIMLNYIAKLFNSFLVSGPMMAEGDVAQSDIIASSARVGEIVEGGKITWAFVFAIAMCVLVWVLFNRTSAGYGITAAGVNARAAQAGGIRPDNVRMGAMLMSGMLAGIAGGMLVASSFGRLVEVVSSGYGFEGISIAVLGQFSSVGIFLSSVLFGGLRTGGLYMEMFMGIPTEIISVLQGVMIVVIASPLIFKVLFKEGGRKNER